MTRSHVSGASHLTLADFETSDPAMARCLAMARAACRTELPILILGESGTGKTFLARAIHNSSPRSSGPFVSFNAAALSDTLLDSQLFGHEKGAFTGAQKQVRGKFELADGGTLFIDEIADMSPLAQAKILRAVEYGEFERLGSEALREADVRLVSATHYPLAKFVDSDHFRSDLFYRIAGLTVTLPPLRERPNDLRALVTAAVLNAARTQHRTIEGLGKGAAEALLAYSWPGNLRELDRVVHAAVALSQGEVIEEGAILLPGLDGVDARPAAAFASYPADQSLGSVERAHVRTVLAALGGNKTRAARALRVSRSTLERKLVASK